jgi:phosphohistidine phosphatase
MDLILWRHAEAQELSPEIEGAEFARLDLTRALTGRGQKHAARVAAWLDRQLTDTARILVSPALRCEQTALNLGRKFKICEQLGPHGSAQDLLELVQGPDSKTTDTATARTRSHHRRNALQWQITARDRG